MGALPGLEDGQLDHHNPDFVADPWPTYDHLRRSCPAHRSEHYGGFWLLSRYADVLSAAKDWQRYSSATPGVLLIPAGVQRDFPLLPIEYDPPRHTLLRQIVAPLFAPRRVNQFNEAIAGIAADLVDGLTAKPTCDLAKDFAIPLSEAALAMFIGLPEQDWSMWSDIVRRAQSVADPDDAARAANEFRRYVEGLIDSRRSERTDDLISTLLDTEIDGTRLDDDQIRGVILMILIAGHDTTATSLSYGLWHLATHPEDQERLRNDAKLIQSAVEEFIRLASPVGIFARNATEPIALGDRIVGDGDVVGLAFAAANRDPEVFAEAESCLVDRQPNRHIAFGAGPHFCLGAQMARREMTLALKALADSGTELSMASEVIWKSRGDARSLASVPARAVPRNEEKN